MCRKESKYLASNLSIPIPSTATIPQALVPNRVWLCIPSPSSEGKLCQALRAFQVSKVIEEILPFLVLYLFKYTQSSPICFSSRSFSGYRVTVVPPSHFAFSLLSDIPVGSLNDPSTWGDMGWKAETPPVPATHNCCRHWHHSWHSSTTQPSQRGGQRPRREGKQLTYTSAGQRESPRFLPHHPFHPQRSHGDPDAIHRDHSPGTQMICPEPGSPAPWCGPLGRSTHTGQVVGLFTPKIQH